MVSNDGAQDVLVYCDELQRSLGAENQRLSDQVEETILDYNDAVRSRRELQKQIETYEKTIRQNKYYQVSIRSRTDYQYTEANSQRRRQNHM
jgi:hypothetical protein